jgi:hypothetical protein
MKQWQGVTARGEAPTLGAPLSLAAVPRRAPPRQPPVQQQGGGASLQKTSLPSSVALRKNILGVSAVLLSVQAIAGLLFGFVHGNLDRLVPTVPRQTVFVLGGSPARGWVFSCKDKLSSANTSNMVLSL